MRNEARIKFDRCCTKLLIRYPFWGSLVLSMTVVESDKIPTMATDGINIYYNPTYLLEQDEEIACTDIAHEGGHKGFMHPLRRGSRDKKLWTIAGDYAINGYLKASGLKIGHDYLHDAKYDGMDAEAIYELLLKNPEQQPQNSCGCGGLMDHPSHQHGNEADHELKPSPNKPTGKGKGQPRGKEQRQDSASQDGQNRPDQEQGAGQDASAGTEADVLTALAQARAFAKGQGLMPSGIDMAVEAIVNPKVRWEAALQQFMERCSSDDFTWRLPDRRFMDSGMYLPSLNSEAINEFVIAFDTSGSIFCNKALVDKFAEHISEITSMLSINKLRIIYCDATVQHVDEFTKAEMPVKVSNVRGGGGTKFEPVFEYIEKEGIQPKGLVYFTDLDGSFPQYAPGYPVLWASIKSRRVPFGEVLFIE